MKALNEMNNFLAKYKLPNMCIIYKITVFTKEILKIIFLKIYHLKKIPVQDGFTTFKNR